MTHAVIRPVDVLLEFLASEQARGVTHVHLDEGARQSLREIFALTKSGSRPLAPGQSAKSSSPAAPPELPTAHAPTEEAKPAAPPAAVVISGASRAEQIESLKQQAETWAPAKTLKTLRETLVFSAGNPEARIMFVGEAPGYQDERERQPFAGPAGQKLNEILKAMGLSRDEVYLSNIVKFRPATPKQTTNNRKPSPEEMAACLPLLRAEIRVLAPECIVALGDTAAEGLLGLEGSVATMRGKWHEVAGRAIRVTYHPSHLLQTNLSANGKRQVWEDMLAVMERLGLPISDRQRAFFLPKT